MSRKLISIMIMSLLLIIFSLLSACEPSDGGDSSITIANFGSTEPGNAPSGWTVDVVTDYTGGDEDGPLVKNLFHGSDNRVLFLMQEALAGDIDPDTENDTYGYGFTGYTYAQIEFEASSGGTLTFDYQSCGWYGETGKERGNIQGSFEFWLDLDLANIDTATDPDWSAPTDSYVYPADDMEHMEEVSVEITEAGTYKLTWKAEKTLADTFEDRACIDNIVFTPDSGLD